MKKVLGIVFMIETIGILVGVGVIAYKCAFAFGWDAVAACIMCAVAGAGVMFTGRCFRETFYDED